ncbi:hypothetical protein A3762_01955 [Oleiphilus sp. HI0125]|uniref:endolytic transglycosylase MltG n=1 Tax=Oleiphilus sp. HI0125 TaxID=1822266 RepID=UPI0007C31312|nr:endolytic transglycosylase MltG [Oleiphilus sp. HI0125]KZZ62866.1 hypothetical protein A3762_01955 [Oleiphilus sp. HI0125]
MKWLKFFLGSVVLFAFLGALAVLSYLRYLEKPLLITEPFVYELKKGSSSNRVINDFHKLGIIEYEEVAKIYVRHKNLSPKLKAGEFEIQRNMTLVELFALLTSNQHVSYKVALIEGSTFKEARAELESDSRLQHVLVGLSDKEVLQKLTGNKSSDLPQKGDFVFTHPEGAIYPDTYFFHKGESDLSILKRAHQRLLKVLDEEWSKRQSKLPLATPYEALILASIVEKETGKPSEREEIAGVFVRRLNKKMRLQTDPTVIYGLGDRYKGNITRKHLKELTPYNTYRINDLPPTPIALAGREAIHAALNPKAGKTLYFVAKGDGSHVFSETLAQHNKAVREYQLRRRSDYKSIYN